MKNGFQTVLRQIVLVFTLLLLPCWVMAADGKTSVVAAEVYIDDYQLVTSVNVDSALDHGFSTALGQIDISSLTPGFHSVYLHFQDNLLQWSQAVGQSFYVDENGKSVGQGGENSLLRAEIFIDTDPGEGNGITTTVPADGVFDETVERIIQSDNVQALAQGMHSAYVRFQDANDNWSLPVGQSFYIIAEGGSGGGITAGGAFGLKAAEAFFDTDPGQGAGIALLNTASANVGVSGEELRDLVAISQLSPGIHSLYLRYQNQSNFWSKPLVQSVYVAPGQSLSNGIGDGQSPIVSAEYAIDDGVFQVAPAADGSFGGLVEQVDITVPVTSDVSHSASVRFIDTLARTSSSLSSVNATVNDQDWDGLPDAWEISNLGGTDYSANDDPDGDGLSNAQEFAMGTNPLVKDNTGVQTISGFVMDTQGNALAGVKICIELNLSTTDCAATTDANGHYVVGENVSLSPATYRIYPENSLSAAYAFNPLSRSVALGVNSVSSINFTAEVLALSLIEPSAPASYQSTQQITLTWSGNGSANSLMVLSMKRDSVPVSQTEPLANDPDWYRFTINTANDGTEVVTLPAGLTAANDWRFHVAYANTSVAASTANFSYEELVINFPLAEIVSVDPVAPIEGELFTLTGQSGLDGHTITQHYWGAVPLQNGVAVGDEIEIGTDALMTTKELAAGSWRFVYQVKDDQGLSSERVTKDVMILSADGLSDLAINRASIRFVDVDGNSIIQANPGDSILMEVDVKNAGRMTMPEAAVVSVYDDLPETGQLFENASVRVLAKDETQTVKIPWIVPATEGYQAIVFTVDFTSNLNVTSPQIIESNRQNNLATAFLIIGTPPPGSYGVEMTAAAKATVIRGSHLTVTGDAHYMWGNHLPVMGALVTGAFDTNTSNNYTLSPNGRYSISLRAPDALGQYPVKIRVYDNNLYAETVIQVTVVDPPVSVPPPPPYCSIYPCPVWTPPPPVLIPDMAMYELSFTGSGLYRTDSGQDAVVQNSMVGLSAQIKNVGNLTATGGFSVRFYDEQDVQIGDVVVYNGDVTPKSVVNISTSAQLSLDALGTKQVYASVSAVAGETNPHNNLATKTVEVRSNRPDLRDNRGIAFSNLPLVGDSVEVILDVLNRGPADLNQAFTVDYYMGDPDQGGTLFDQQTLAGNLLKGEASRSSVTLTPQNEGDLEIYAVIDASNTINEDSEFNNITHATLHVCPASLNQSISLRASNSYPGMGVNIQLSATVANRCGLASTADSINFYQGDPANGGLLIGNVAVPEIAGGSYATLSLPWTTPTLPGQTVLYAQLVSNQLLANTSVYITTTPVPSPDLQVYSDDIFRVSPAVGDAVQLSTFIRNVSTTESASNFAVNFYADSPNEFKKIGDTIVIEQALLPGSQITVSANNTFIANEALYSILVEVIPNIQQGDSNSTDNKATTSFQVDGLVTIAEMPTVSLLTARADSTGLVTGSFSVTHSENQIKNLRVHYANTPTFENSLFTDIGIYSELQATGEKTFSFDASQWIDQTIYYKVEVYNVSGLQTLPAPQGNVVLSSVNLPAIENPTIIDDAGVNAYIFRVQLTESVPAGYGVFLNFDDLQGDWFKVTDDGGHFLMQDLGGGVYEYHYTLQKPGLRSVRAGIFDTQGGANLPVGGYSSGTTCTLTSCIDAVLNEHRSKTGNPAISGTGSQLFNNVNVANGNYHLSKTDLSVAAKGPSFNFSRAYNSLAASAQQWTFGYEMNLQFVDGSNRLVKIAPREDGRIQYYFKDMDKRWYALNAGNFDRLIENPDYSFTLYTQGNRLYRFNKPAVDTATGSLRSIEDRLGNALVFEYSANGELTGATDANGRKYTIKYAMAPDGVNRVSRVSDFTGRYVEYGYDSNGMITQVRNVRGGFDSYTYTGFQLKTISDPRGYLQLTINYDLTGRVNDLTDGLNNFTDIKYGTAYTNGPQATGIEQPQVDGLNHNRVYILDDGRTKVVEIIDAKNYGDATTENDITTKQEFLSVNERKRLAESGLVYRVTEPNNVALQKAAEITYYNDGTGNPKTITDAGGHDTTATYGILPDQENLTPVASITQPGVATPTTYQGFTSTGKAGTIIDPLNNKTSRAFDSNDWVKQSINARNYSTHYVYDAYGNVTSITDALGNTTMKTYGLANGLRRLTTETSPLGLTTSYAYDESGNVKSTTRQAADGINYTTSHEYDASGNLIKTTDPLGQVTNYVYDELNRKIEENYLVNNQPHKRSYSYDALGRLATVTNEMSETTTTHYDERSKVKSKVDALSNITQSYTYDNSGNILTITDGEGRTVSYEYDELNRKTKVTDDLGHYQQWTYNNAGQVATYQDKRGLLTSYLYDANGKVIQVTDPEGGVTKSEYDANGNVIKVTDARGNFTSYAYDELDRRISTRLNNDASKTWLYEYDANGNQTREVTPEGEVTVQQYDALNRVKRLTEYDALSAVTRDISYQYDANNNVKSLTSGGNTISYSYDEINRVTSVTDTYGQTISYGYDKAGNRTSLTYPGNKTINYVYDEVNRLKTLTDWLNNSTSYTRNKAGQPVNVTYGNGTKATYVYDNAGRLTQLNNLQANGTVISSHVLTLDGSGNIANSLMDLPLLPRLPASSGMMSYDNNNRILNAGTNSYEHDLSGRIIKEDKSGIQTIFNFDINDHISSITQDGSTLSNYQYDLNNNRISQTQNGVETRYVIDQLASLPNVVAETDSQGVVQTYYIYGDGLVSQIDATGNSHYYHFDPTGHTLALTDDSGAISDKYAYSPYGFTTSEGSTHNPFRYVGKYGVMDDENGLHYMRARYYSEDIKRFLSLDALHGDIMTPQALNRYAYVLGNPLSGIDPSGYYSFIDAVKYGAKITWKKMFGPDESNESEDNEESDAQVVIDTSKKIERYRKMNNVFMDMCSAIKTNEGLTTGNWAGCMELQLEFQRTSFVDLNDDLIDSLKIVYLKALSKTNKGVGWAVKVGLFLEDY